MYKGKKEREMRKGWEDEMILAVFFNIFLLLRFSLRRKAIKVFAFFNSFFEY